MSSRTRKSNAPASKAAIQTALCRLSYETEDEFISKYAQNLSKTGIFIGTTKPKPVGDILRFELQLKDGTSLVKGKGEVTWNRSDSPSGAPTGMGVKYLQLDEKGKSLIKKVMAYKAAHGDKFDRPSRYSMAPGPNLDAAEREEEENRKPAKESAEPEKKQKMKKIDLNEIDSLLDDLAISKVSTRERVRFRRRPSSPPAPVRVPVPRPSSPPAAYASSAVEQADTMAPPAPELEPRVQRAEAPYAPTMDPGSPFGEARDSSPGLLYDADEFPTDGLGMVAPDKGPSGSYGGFESEIVEDSDEIQIERISQEEISNIAEVEDLKPSMEIEAELLEPDVDSEPPQSREAVALSDEDLAGVLEDVYSQDQDEAPANMIQEDELDALLSVLEDGGDEDDVEELEELDVVEIDEDN